jgi:hypothetical protein
MPGSDFDRKEVFENKKPTVERAPDAQQPGELDWASAVGNSAVQRIASSPGGRRTPVAPGMMPLATAALARQAEDEELIGEGAGTATAEPEAAPEPPEAAETELPEAAAAPEGGESETELEEEQTY